MVGDLQRWHVIIVIIDTIMTYSLCTFPSVFVTVFPSWAQYSPSSSSSSSSCLLRTDGLLTKRAFLLCRVPWRVQICTYSFMYIYIYIYCCRMWSQAHHATKQLGDQHLLNTRAQSGRRRSHRPPWGVNTDLMSVSELVFVCKIFLPIYSATVCFGPSISQCQWMVWTMP